VLEKRDSKFSELTFERAILDSLTANIAVIDKSGEILAVNASWQEFAAANQMHDAAMGIGTNYFDVCRAAIVDPSARTALKGIGEVLDGTRSSFYHEYPCHSPAKKRWFALRATPLVDYPDFVVVSHEDITERLVSKKSST